MANQSEIINLDDVNENDAMSNYFMVKEEKPVIIPGCISIFFFYHMLLFFNSNSND
jgi:hypothetical protein